jgi:hypothetical protein
MRGPGQGRDGRDNYGWSDCQADLEDGVHPAVVGARLGEPETYVREIAGQQGWAIVWDEEAKPAAFADPDWLDA